MKLIIYCFPHYNVSPMRAETLYCWTYCASGSASHTVGAPQLQSCSDACFEKVNLFQHHLTIRKQFEHNVNFAFCVILFTRNPTWTQKTPPAELRCVGEHTHTLQMCPSFLLTLIHTGVTTFQPPHQYLRSCNPSDAYFKLQVKNQASDEESYLLQWKKKSESVSCSLVSHSFQLHGQ